MARKFELFLHLLFFVQRAVQRFFQLCDSPEKQLAFFKQAAIELLLHRFLFVQRAVQSDFVSSLDAPRFCFNRRHLLPEIFAGALLRSSGRAYIDHIPSRFVLLLMSNVLSTISSPPAGSFCSPTFLSTVSRSTSAVPRRSSMSAGSAPGAL